MNKSLLIALCLGGALSGCSQTQRYVTTKTWFGQDRLMVATSTVKTNLMFKSWTADVISCDHQPDHSLVCRDEPELNQYLNQDNTEK